MCLLACAVHLLRLPKGRGAKGGSKRVALQEPPVEGQVFSHGNYRKNGVKLSKIPNLQSFILGFSHLDFTVFTKSI